MEQPAILRRWPVASTVVHNGMLGKRVSIVNGQSFKVRFCHWLKLPVVAVDAESCLNDSGVLNLAWEMSLGVRFSRDDCRGVIYQMWQYWRNEVSGEEVFVRASFPSIDIDLLEA